jgi:hypothetical protein
MCRVRAQLTLREWQMSEHSDMLLAFYNEHVEMARQHETQRSTLTSFIPTISGVLIGFVATTFKFGS